MGNIFLIFSLIFFFILLFTDKALVAIGDLYSADVCRRKLATAPEGILAYLLDTAERNSLKSATEGKGGGLDFGHLLGKLNGFEGATAVKRLHTDALNAVSKLYRDKIVATEEGIVTYSLNSVGKRDACKGAAGVECTDADALYPDVENKFRNTARGKC